MRDEPSPDPPPFDIMAAVEAVLAGIDLAAPADIELEDVPTGTGIYLMTAHAVRDIDETHEEVRATFSLTQGGTREGVRLAMFGHLRRTFPKTEGWHVYCALHELPLEALTMIRRASDHLYP